MMWLDLLVYASILFFIAVAVAKATKLSRMPPHLRWELYPVAHTVGHETGGSYMEDLNWRDTTPRKSQFGVLKYMAKEGLLFKKCFKNNRGLWYFTYPFHIGTFLLIAGLIILFGTAVTTTIAGTSFVEPTGFLARTIIYSALGAGVAGLILNVFGSFGLLIKRSTDQNLKTYSAPLDYFNLTLVLATVMSASISWLLFDRSLIVSRQVIVDLITFSPITGINPAMAIAMVLFCLFLIYMPFTHMMHGMAKYFTYHTVVWDDEARIKGSKLEMKVNSQLVQAVDWAAPHIHSGKSWIEIVSEHEEKDA